MSIAGLNLLSSPYLACYNIYIITIMSSYIPLRAHTHYSLLSALPQMPDIVKKAAEYGYTAMAITDTNNLYGCIEFYKECKKKNIKPILATEIIINYGGINYPVAFYAKNEDGYRKLLKLVSHAQLSDYIHPHIIESDIANLLADQMTSQSVIASAQRVKILDALSKYIHNDDMYLELTKQAIDENNTEVLSNTKYKLLPTQHSRYLSINDKEAHRVIVNVHSDEESEEKYKSEYKPYDLHFLSPTTADEWFAGYTAAMENCKEIENKCNVELVLGKWYFPKIETRVSPESDLRELVYKGILDRGLDPNDPALLERVEYELSVICEKGFAVYFLVVYDLLRYARENKILTNIRGSVAGSMVTYLLRITKCNPFTYKLPFERFLNRERPSAPDIDMDYADDRRDEVLNYTRQKYGKQNVAQIGTFGAMLARGAVRDVARALKYPYIVGDRISRMIPPPRQGFPVTIDMALEEVPELKEMYDSDRETMHIIDMSKKVEGCVRHISVHAAGTVIAPSAVSDFAPIQWDPKGEKIITQYEMNAVGEDNVGLLKYDFLGIRNLSILATAIENVKEEYNVDIDIEEVPVDDPKTFAMLSRGETVGLFQLNGSGMTKFLKELKPSTIYDINAMVALYRPGPLEMIPEYIKRKHNPELVSYLDKRLEPILDQSFGVIVYQDDVMLTAIHLAGYSWLEADKLRKAMGKKIPEEMQAQKIKLFKGFKENGLSDNKINTLWEQIEPFAAYGFNKAHAASYGRVAYQTAYMKANYPYAYMTAVLTHESGDVEKINEIVAECKRMGIHVLPPNINFSNTNFSIVKNANTSGQLEEEIRFGLLTVKNLGHDIADAIVDERNKNGKYKSLEDFLERVKHKNLNKKSLEALTMCGALDDFAERGVILANSEAILDYHKTFVKDSTAQDSLFAGLSDDSHKNITLKPAPPIDITTKLKWERELLGLYVSGFPLDPWKEKILARSVNILAVLEEISDGTEVNIPALVESVKVTKTKKGDRMALVNLRDYTGSFEVAVFPESYLKFKDYCKADMIVVVRGKVSSRNGTKTLVVDDMKELK